MLIWLKNAPNADKMLELLSQSQFHEKITTYIDHNICTHLDGFDKKYVQENACEPHILSSRPPDPRQLNWKEVSTSMEWRLARAHQVHVCKSSTCLQKN
jgi:hypothetical protein